MALPADFSKIFGSTATGGLTPISDVNYSKGWEYAGANPPTKNDFSYLQNMSDLKSQWLYNYLNTSTNAASRLVGTGANNIPDMTRFQYGSNGLGSWFKHPSGIIIQFGLYPVSGASGGIAFPTSFTQAPSYTLSPTATAGVMAVSSGSTTTGINNVRVFDTSGAILSNGVVWIAMGY